MTVEGIALPTGQVCCEQVCGELAAMRRLDCGVQHFLWPALRREITQQIMCFPPTSVVGCTSRLCIGFFFLVLFGRGTLKSVVWR